MHDYFLIIIFGTNVAANVCIYTSDDVYGN